MKVTEVHSVKGHTFSVWSKSLPCCLQIDLVGIQADQLTIGIHRSKERRCMTTQTQRCIEDTLTGCWDEGLKDVGFKDRNMSVLHSQILRTDSETATVLPC